MDPVKPLRSIVPTVEGDVLTVLARTSAPLTGATVTRLCGRSDKQVRDVLARLTDAGLVDSARVGAAIQFKLNRDHVLAPPILSSVFACDTVEQWISDFISTAYPQPRAVVLFGSFARRDGTVDSDVDLLIVRPDSVDEDLTSWTEMRADLIHCIERWTGNRCQLVEVSSANLTEAITSDQPLIQSLRMDGRVISGDSLDKLFARPHQVGTSRVKP